MKRFFVLLFWLMSLPALATFNAPLTISKISDDHTQFIFLRKDGEAPWNGIIIKDPLTKAILYEVKVLKCNENSCLGVVTRNLSGMRLLMDEKYVHSYLEGPLKGPPAAPVKKEVPPKIEPRPEPKPEPRPEPKPEPKPEHRPEPKPEPKPLAETPAPVEKIESAPAVKNLFLGYGSPIGPGFRIGFNRQFRERIWTGISYAKIGSETNKVGIDGHLLSGNGIYQLYRLSSQMDVNLLGELGLTKATMDYTAIDAGGTKSDETTFLISMGGEATYALEKIKLSLRSGFSKTGLKSPFQNDQGTYANPYGTILVFMELGFYYQF